MKELDELCIIMNPPYDRNLHLDILDKVIEEFPENEIVNLSPVRWLQDPLAEYKKNSDWFKFEDVRKKISDLEVINYEDANKFFNTSLFVNLGIYLFSKKRIDISKVFKENSIITKVLNSNSIGWPVKNFNECLNFVLVRSIMNGNLIRDKKPLSAIRNSYGYFINKLSNGKTVEELKKLNKSSVFGNIENWLCVEFDTEKETINFFKFNDTKFFKYILKKLVIDQSVPLKFLPFMPTYEHEWTDEMLYEYFDLTEEEIKVIEEEIDSLV